MSNTTWEHIQVLCSFIPTMILIYIAYRQWKTDDNTRRNLLIDRYVKNYQKISKAIELTIKNAEVCDKALAFYWKARDESRLMLDDKIAIYTEKLFNLGHEYYLNSRLVKREMNVNQKKEKINRNDQILAIIMEMKPHEIYAKFMKP